MTAPDHTLIRSKNHLHRRHPYMVMPMETQLKVIEHIGPLNREHASK